MQSLQDKLKILKESDSEVDFWISKHVGIRLRKSMFDNVLSSLLSSNLNTCEEFILPIISSVPEINKFVEDYHVAAETGSLIEFNEGVSNLMSYEIENMFSEEEEIHYIELESNKTAIPIKKSFANVMMNNWNEINTLLIEQKKSLLEKINYDIAQVHTNFMDSVNKNSEQYMKNPLKYKVNIKLKSIKNKVNEKEELINELDYDHSCVVALALIAQDTSIISGRLEEDVKYFRKINFTEDCEKMLDTVKYLKKISSSAYYAKEYYKSVLDNNLEFHEEEFKLDGKLTEIKKARDELETLLLDTFYT